MFLRSVTEDIPIALLAGKSRHRGCQLAAVTLFGILEGGVTGT
jgi:hypothetical protein